MRTLYIECKMGAAGDMVMAALLELHPSPEDFLNRMNHLGLPGVSVEREPSTKCGITGSHIRVSVRGEEEESTDYAPDHAHHHERRHRRKLKKNLNEAHSHDHEHEQDHEHNHGHEHEHGHSHDHATLQSVTHLIDTLAVSAAVKQNAKAVYSALADAEAKAHGVPVAQVHFHEVGMLDAIADVVGVCLLMEDLAPARILASPIHLGGGQVKCSHGIMPVPAPATAYLVSGIPTYTSEIRGELCTPTGAALLKHFVTGYGPQPIMNIQRIGYGMGKKDFPMANCVRAFLGDPGTAQSGLQDTIVELSCNLDDMNGEEIGYASEQLRSAGALDVFTVAIGMKKNRPAQMLVCLCPEPDADRMAVLMLEHTSTFGVRKNVLTRYTLERSFKKVATPYGEISVKTGTGYGIKKAKPEYDDMAKAAATHQVSLRKILDSVSSSL